jgi:adenosylhomocysteine nucleosidase/adenosylhomocysteine/aminodeoxyfutalosine nucleosidase
MEFKNILILTAMDQEFEDCLKKEEFSVQKVSLFEIEVFTHTFNDKKIHIAKTGVGPINASAVTAILLDSFKVDLVMLLGLGGALDRRLGLGDVCIATHIIQHDAVCTYDDKTEQMACGELHLSLSPDKRPDIKIPTNSSINEKVGLFLKNRGFNLFTGDILSGSEFNASLVKKEQMKDRFKNSVLVEMEASGVGLICKKLQVPFVVIKTVADTLTKTPDQEYKDFLLSSAKKCADVFDFARAL